MKHILKLAMSAFFFLGFLSFIQAQGPGRGDGPKMDPAQRAEQQTTRMTEKLALSTAQSAKVKEINLKYAEQGKAARDANTSGDWSAMREKMTAMRAEQDKELKTVLTSDQWTSWEKIRTEERGNRDGSKGKGKGDGTKGKRGPKKGQAPPPPPPAPAGGQ